MLTLQSERVAFARVIGCADTIFPPPAGVLDHYVTLRVDEWLVGHGKKQETIALRVDRILMPQAIVGDSILVFWETFLPDAENGTADTSVATDLIDLADLSRSSPGAYALTNDFGVYPDGRSVLKTVLRRATMIRAHHPLGDERTYTAQDFRRGLGTLTDWMPDDSEAEKRTWSGSLNWLSYPADSSLLRVYLPGTRDSSPEVRAWAAWQLHAYSNAIVERRLREMLHDTGRTSTTSLTWSGAVDTTWYPGVRNAARSALNELGVRFPGVAGTLQSSGTREHLYSPAGSLRPIPEVDTGLVRAAECDTCDGAIDLVVLEVRDPSAVPDGEGAAVTPRGHMYVQFHRGGGGSGSAVTDDAGHVRVEQLRAGPIVVTVQYLALADSSERHTLLIREHATMRDTLRVYDHRRFDRAPSRAPMPGPGIAEPSRADRKAAKPMWPPRPRR